MRRSTCFTITMVFIIAAIAALICAIICDAMNNSDRSITFGCIACACAIPAFSCGLILFQAGIDGMKELKESETEEAVVDEMIQEAEISAVEEENADE